MFVRANQRSFRTILNSRSGVEQQPTLKQHIDLPRGGRVNLTQKFNSQDTVLFTTTKTDDRKRDREEVTYTFKRWRTQFRRSYSYDSAAAKYVLKTTPSQVF